MTVQQQKDNITIDSFRATEFGQRLLHWIQLPSQLHAQRAWESYSKACSLYWFMNLATLLSIFQEWTMLHRFQSDVGFLDGSTALGLPHVLSHPTIKSRLGSQARSPPILSVSMMNSTTAGRSSSTRLCDGVSSALNHTSWHLLFPAVCHRGRSRYQTPNAPAVTILDGRTPHPAPLPVNNPNSYLRPMSLNLPIRPLRLKP
jgi:hypothetical protein